MVAKTLITFIHYSNLSPELIRKTEQFLFPALAERKSAAIG